MTTEDRGSRRMSVLVFLAHGQGDENWEDRLRRGDANNPGPYGYAYARDRVDVIYASSRAESRATRAFRLGLKFVLGFDVLHGLHNRGRLHAADIVWTHTEKEHLAVGLLKLVGLVPSAKPVIAQSVWLWGWLPTAGRLRRGLTLRLLRQNQIHTVLAADGVTIGSPILGKPVILVPYGITPDPPVTPIAPRPRPVVIAPGNDKDRDWRTLGEAAQLCPDMDFVILSRRAAAQPLGRLPNVEVRQAASQAEMTSEYANCDVVVVPVKQNPHASGATTVLQATGIGRPVVTTRVGGIDLYGGDTAFYSEVADAESLAAALRQALAHGTTEHCRRAREALVARGLTEVDYARRHVLLSEDLLAGAPPRPSVSSDVSLVGPNES